MYEKIVQLKMLSSDGKRYKTDVANMEQRLRIIQSVPFPKAEPFQVLNPDDDFVTVSFREETVSGAN